MTEQLTQQILELVAQGGATAAWLYVATLAVALLKIPLMFAGLCCVIWAIGKVVSGIMYPHRTPEEAAVDLITVSKIALKEWKKWPSINGENMSEAMDRVARGLEALAKIQEGKTK